MDTGPVDTEAVQCAFRRQNQTERPAQIPAVDLSHREQRRQQPGQSLPVEPAGRQTGLLLLTGEHRHQLEPVRVAVLEVGDLVQEHRRGRGPVAPDQTEPGRRLRASSVDAIDNTGVMPLPPTIAA